MLTDRQTDRQTGRQTERNTDKSRVKNKLFGRGKQLSVHGPDGSLYSRVIDLELSDSHPPTEALGRLIN